ncbi:MAG: ribonuclease III domain-containing protein [Candidatus Melainabacteria bacterium]|nr:ribonuclease III domain-containing protein [Candidatus Melainabacteria bacterium]
MADAPETADEAWLSDLGPLTSNKGEPGPETTLDPSALHPRELAHLGDAVYELFVRQHALTVCRSRQSDELHRYTTARCKGTFQAGLLQHLLQQLTEAEQQLMRRARNTPVSVRRRSEQAVHRQATAFEALIGWWYLTDRLRLNALLRTLRGLMDAEETATAMAAPVSEGQHPD